MKVWFLTCISFFLSYGIQGETTSTCKTEKLIVDCDGDLDDLLAITYLLKQKRIELDAITVTSCGKTHYEYGANNILRLLDYMKNPRIAVATSDKPPLEFNGFYPLEYRKEANELYGIKLPQTDLEPFELPSHDLLINKVLSSDSQVTILCTAPLTNLARALKKEPSIKNKIDRVYILGGALNVKGNILERYHGYYNRFAEYNIFLDGKAAKIVLSSGVPITLIPLDVLASVASMHTEIYRHLIKMDKTETTELIKAALNPIGKPYFSLNKELTFLGVIGASLIAHPEIGELFPLNLKLNLDYGPYYGMLSIERQGFPVDVCLKIYHESFYQVFIEDILN